MGAEGKHPQDPGIWELDLKADPMSVSHQQNVRDLEPEFEFDYPGENSSTNSLRNPSTQGWPLRLRQPIVYGLVVGVVLLGLITWFLVSNRQFFFATSPLRQPVDSWNQVAGTSGTRVGGTIIVDVHGDVRHPGVYTLDANARTIDAIRAAGGYLHPEDATYMNAAAPLDDGQEVVVPIPATDSRNGVSTQSATPSQSTVGASVSAEQGQNSSKTNAIAVKIDLNTASQATLETLPGIGPTRAVAIVRYRTEHGGFKTAEELQEIPGIGQKTFAKIQPFVVVLSPTHAPQP